MKLSMLPIVRRTAEALDKLQLDIEAAEKDMVLVTIADRLQDEALVASIRFALLTELQARKASLHRDLESYGVTLA